jgi:hypothetical protein
MSRVNDALAHIAAGKARYRVVLENDLRRQTQEHQVVVEVRG